MCNTLALELTSLLAMVTLQATPGTLATPVTTTMTTSTAMASTASMTTTTSMSTTVRATLADLHKHRDLCAKGRAEQHLMSQFRIVSRSTCVWPDHVLEQPYTVCVLILVSCLLCRHHWVHR
jgi:hypothetical protein